MDMARKLTNQEQTAPEKVEFSYGGNDWLQYEPRRAVSNYFCCTGGRCHLYQNGWRRVLEEK